MIAWSCDVGVELAWLQRIGDAVSSCMQERQHGTRTPNDQRLDSPESGPVLIHHVDGDDDERRNGTPDGNAGQDAIRAFTVCETSSHSLSDVWQNRGTSGSSRGCEHGCARLDGATATS